MALSADRHPGLVRGGWQRRALARLGVGADDLALVDTAPFLSGGVLDLTDRPVIDLREGLPEAAGLGLAPAIEPCVPPPGPASDTPAALVRRGLRRGAPVVFLVADTIALTVAFLGGMGLAHLVNGRGQVQQLAATVLYVPVFLGVFSLYGLYRRSRRRLVASSFPDVTHLGHALLVGSLFTVLASGPAHRELGLPSIDRTQLAFLTGLAVVLVPIARAAARRVVRPTAARVLIVGSGQVAASVARRLNTCDDMDVIGYADDPVASDGPAVLTPFVVRVGGLDRLPELCREHQVDWILVAFSPTPGDRLAGVLRELASEVQISVVPRLFDLLTVRSTIDDLHGLPVIDVAPASLGAVDRFAKRALDIAAAGIGLLLLAPVMAVIAIAIKATSRGPVLFRQERAGRDGRTFKILKFRTMRVGAAEEHIELVTANEVDGPLFKIRSDPRVTRVGSLLRRTSLDEIPQLINVLVGQMSLVGPRPFVIPEASQIDGWAARRFDVRPGMTGLWQVSGRSDLPFGELCRLDYTYVASWSLWWDLKILWHTPACVLRSQGAY